MIFTSKAILPQAGRIGRGTKRRLEEVGYKQEFETHHGAAHSLPLEVSGCHRQYDE